MKTKLKNIKIEFKVTESSIDIYVENNFAGGFNLDYSDGYLMIRPEAFDLEEIGYGRMGVYSFVIDTILNNELSLEMEDELGEIIGIDFESVLRTEKACNFWLKRGYGSDYDEEDHVNGEQDIIEIRIK